jgi:hypothetical protein
MRLAHKHKTLARVLAKQTSRLKNIACGARRFNGAVTIKQTVP